MDLVGRKLWQVGAGDTERNYADLCLRWDVMLAGPGTPGPYTTEAYASLGDIRNSAPDEEPHQYTGSLRVHAGGSSRVKRNSLDSKEHFPMLKRTLLTFALLSCWLAAPASSQVSKYRTVRAQDMSYGSVVRINIRVSIPAHFTKSEVERIAKYLVDSVSRQRRVNAVSVMFFGPGTATDGPWDVAAVDWAPNGDWAQADAARAGDYQSFRYSVSYRPARSAPSAGSLVLSDRRGLLGAPLPRGASLIARREGNPETGHDPSERYQVKASAHAIATFYLREMPKLGWLKDGAPTQGALFFKKGRQMLGVLINQSGGTFTLMGS